MHNNSSLGLEPGDSEGPITLDRALRVEPSHQVWRVIHEPGARMHMIVLNSPRELWMHRLLIERMRWNGLNHPVVSPIADVTTFRGWPAMLLPEPEGLPIREALGTYSFSPAMIRALTVSLLELLVLAHQRRTPIHCIEAEQLYVRVVEEEATLTVVPGALRFFDLNAELAVPGAEQTALHGYRSPEQLRGEPGQLQSDLWGVGCFLFQLSAGRGPFVATEPERLRQQILNGVPSSYPPVLDTMMFSILRDTLVRQPKERVSASALLARLQGPPPAQDSPRPRAAPRLEPPPAPPEEDVEEDFSHCSGPTLVAELSVLEELYAADRAHDAEDRVTLPDPEPSVACQIGDQSVDLDDWLSLPEPESCYDGVATWRGPGAPRVLMGGAGQASMSWWPMPSLHPLLWFVLGVAVCGLFMIMWIELLGIS